MRAYIVEAFKGTRELICVRMVALALGGSGALALNLEASAKAIMSSMVRRAAVGNTYNFHMKTEKCGGNVANKSPSVVLFGGNTNGKKLPAIM